VRVFAVLAVIVSVLFASQSWASLPVSVTFKERRTSLEGEPFLLYTVECSNGRFQSISAWDNRTLWCPQLKRNEQFCVNQQLALAKMVCRAGDVLARY
jgi:hypothetical protein